MIWRCDLAPQYDLYKDKIKECIDRIGASGRYILADEVREFEKKFAQYLGVKHVVGVANGTDALVLILKALNIGAGDEVITTAYTAIPTVSAIIEAGATPVFVDICEDTFLMDVSKIKEAITEKTKAIMPVHIFGNVLDIEELKKAVGDIPVIEDAFQAHGSSIGGKKAGSMGIAGAFSFYPTKNLGGYGDGGAIATNSDEIAETLMRLRMYGMTDKDHIIYNGINSRLDELQAAILSVKLDDLDAMNQSRNHIAERYRMELTSGLIAHQKIEKNVYSNYHVYTVRFRGDRDGLVEALIKEDIQTNVYYPIPLHLQEANKYLGYQQGDLPVTEQLCNEALAIAMYPELEMETLDYIIEKMNYLG